MTLKDIWLGCWLHSNDIRIFQGFGACLAQQLNRRYLEVRYYNMNWIKPDVLIMRPPSWRVNWFRGPSCHRASWSKTVYLIFWWDICARTNVLSRYRKNAILWNKSNMINIVNAVRGKEMWYKQTVKEYAVSKKVNKSHLFSSRMALDRFILNFLGRFIFRWKDNHFVISKSS
jgi:hypothetical protein